MCIRDRDQRAKYLYVQDHLPEVRAVFKPLGYAVLLYPGSWTLTAFAEILYFVHCYKQSMALFKEPQAA